MSTLHARALLRAPIVACVEPHNAGSEGIGPLPGSLGRLRVLAKDVNISKSSVSLNILNPMALALGPIQRLIGKSLRVVRTIRRVVGWTNAKAGEEEE